MTKTEVFWKSFWDNATSTQHESEEIDWLKKHATELASIIPKNISSVLEIGCADGRLSSELGFAEYRYTGVDFSTTLLSRLPREKFGMDSQFFLEDGSKFYHGEKYDLIFSNAVIQNFDEPMLRSHLKNSLNMLEPGGVIICGDVPDESKRFAYLSRKRNGKISYRGILAYLLGKSTMIWYRKSKIKSLAFELGLTAEFIEGQNYPYRYHVVLKLR